MTESQTIFRVHRDERDKWTPLLNATIQDKRMTFRATGLLVYLLSLPSDWKISQQHIAKAKKEGRDAVITALNELRKFGYVTKELIRDKGVIVGTVWNVFESPRLTGKPETAEPETAEPPAGNPPLQRKEDTKDATASPSLNGGSGEPSIKSKVSNSAKVPTSPAAIRIAGMFNRKTSREWFPKEIKQFKKLQPIDLDDLALLETYYAFERQKGGDGIHRRDLYTFLNNYYGELDRARAWRENPKANEKKTATNGHRQPLAASHSNSGTSNASQASQY